MAAAVRHMGHAENKPELLLAGTMPCDLKDV